MIRYLRLLSLGMVALGASACSMPMTNGEDQAISPTERYPITVEPQVATMAVAIDDGMQRLAPGEADLIRAFAELWEITQARQDNVGGHTMELCGPTRDPVEFLDRQLQGTVFLRMTPQ